MAIDALRDLTDGPKPASHQVGTRLLFDNERVRVWEIRLAPGERTERHRHQADFLSIYLTHSQLRLVSEKGGEEGGESDTQISEVFSDEGPGFIDYRELRGSFVHTVENVGDAAHWEIVVELKGPEALPETESAADPAIPPRP